ncbi:MAG: DUF2304 domain-containing protein [Clostridiales bacterium]
MLTLSLRLFIFIIGSLFTFIIMYFLLKKRISERNSIPYVLGLSIIITLIIFPDILDFLSYKLGIDYPPALLFLFAILYLFILNIYQTIQLSIFNEQIRELSQHMVLNKNSYKQDDANE